MLLLLALEIFFIWSLLALVLIGLGSIFLSRFANNHSLLDAFWLGLAASAAFLEIWNLLLPINSWLALFVFFVGVFGLLANRSALLNRLRTAPPSSRWLFWPALAIVLFLALRSSGPCDYYDTGLYGASAVRWILTYPAVPGLANLHGRLGFNSSVFLFVAALQHGLWVGLALHLFGGLLMAAFCLALLPACARVAGSSPAPVDWFYSILAIPAIFWATRSKIVGTLTDEPAAIACLIAAAILFESLSHANEDAPRPPDPSRLLVATALFSLAVVFKLSTVVFALLAWCLALRQIWLTAPSPPKRNLHFAAAVLFPAAILVPWLARSIILSGYPFYPATLFGFPMDWKVPLSVARLYAVGVQSWGRLPDAPIADTRGWAWLGVWLHQALRNRVGFQVPVAISLVGLAVVFALLLRRQPRSAFPALWLLLPSLPAIVFWFLASPDMRFGQFAIWTVAATLGSWGIVSLTSQRPAARVRNRAAFAILLLLLFWCLVSFGWQQPYHVLLAVKALPPLPKPDLVLRRTRSGFPVYVPTQGNQCWDAPLPCTPYFDETLRLRKPPSFRWGFTSQFTAGDLQQSSSPVTP
ncbi:MAG TPA: hypothetical protein VFN26_20160 [Candidatus Acidoferrum sp.]|nr:hypothetical protein [Candidatus Acidoferrum sp.]